MYYVEVLVGDATFHGGEALTYASDTVLHAGRVVSVPLRSKRVLGIVAAVVPRPHFKVKPILEVPEIAPLPAQSLKLLQWLRDYYPAPLGVITQLFLPKALPRKPLELQPAPLVDASLPPLTDDQARALKQIAAPGLQLLHAETGSGKTRVYLELAQRAVAAQKSAIILTPEISLTPQLEDTFRAVFGAQAIVVHSGLSDATRQRLWLYILQQKGPVVLLGARSALFSPVANLGLIVIDEAHETAYKQDQAPYYHATSVAAQLAKLHNTTLVIGSATPLVSDYYIASAKQRPIIRLTQSAIARGSTEQAKIVVVDLKDRNAFKKSAVLSDQLIADIQATLGRREQTLLFLNRRGTARIVFCDSCGWQATCPHCDLPLVYHGDLHHIRCHSCGYKVDVASSCPKCGNASIVFKSIGTKAVTAEVARLFPQARIQRFDNDNRKSERLEAHYHDIHAGKIDILIGTQTLAKGLDLPNLSLVGVIIADTSLYFPDFSASERTYQLLSQVAGRVGRGHRAGKVVVQTYTPDSPLLHAVITKNWQQFYESELAERRLYHFPPFCYLLKLSCRRASTASAEQAAQRLATTLGRDYPQLHIDGPAPAFHEKVQGQYTWQLILKAQRRNLLTTIVTQLPTGWSYDIDPMNLL